MFDDDRGYVYDTLGTEVNEYTIRFRTALTRKLTEEGEEYLIAVDEIVTTKTLTISVPKPRLLVIVDL